MQNKFLKRFKQLPFFTPNFSYVKIVRILNTIAVNFHIRFALHLTMLTGKTLVQVFL